MANATDTFTGTNGDTITGHTSDSGHSWTLGQGASGNGQIQSNQAAASAGASPWFYISAVPASVDYDVQCDVSGTSYAGGPCGRMSTTQNDQYKIWYNAGGANRWEFDRVVAGASTSLGTYSGDAPSTTRTVKLEIRDATKKLFIGGVERISSTNNAITAAGRAGFNLSGTASERLDNWSATDAGGGAATTKQYRLMTMGCS